MPGGAAPPAGGDGSVHPERGSATFERDVQRMFATIADRYDTFNHLATFGLDLLWRPRAVWALARSRPEPVRRILDVGCGTGALGRLLAAAYPGATVVGLDFTARMVTRARAISGGRKGRPGYALGAVPRLPFADGAFDVVASAFVARNFADFPRAFAELRRVLRPDGRLLTLEVSEPPSPIVQRLFHAHFDHAVPLLGRAFDRAGPYSYLPRSLRTFPPPEELAAILRTAGFPGTRTIRLSGGIVTAYLSAAA